MKNLVNWKDEEPGNYEKKVKRFFDRERFLKMLKEWILFYVKDDELRKTVLRQHQVRAVEKIVERCADKVRKTGLIWHTQGSGKTFTMITAAKQILERKDFFSKPTVILMIDRNELETQLSGWVDRILGELKNLDIKIETATSKSRLQELLKSDFRGLIVSMIHKFEDVPKNINTRENVFVFMDEAHRSVGGDLGNYLTAALPNATLIGFTGTPIDKTAYGKGTFKVFGKEDDKGYLDKYSIAESIEDGTTVSLKYALAPNEIRVPNELLEKEFLDLVEAEGVSDIDELNKILDKAIKLKTFLKSNQRVEQVAQFVAKHFRGNVEPLGYKAFLVGVDREACALYKEALDKILPSEYSEAVYSPAQHDSEKYPLVYKHQLTTEDEKKFRKLFVKPGQLPKIFIVTDKLLTGFDAEILYCMYLDKPMRDHVLLQAIARVNRPYEQDNGFKKPCGLVVDFVGIFGKLEKALSFDSDVVKGVIENIDLVLLRFKQMMAKDAKPYLDLCKPPVNDKAIEKAIDALADKDDREKFFKFYKEIETLYEILSPSPELRDYIKDVGNLGTLYKIIVNAYKKKTPLYGDVAKKTEMLLRDNAETYGLNRTLPAVTIDENTLKALKENNSTDNSKIINLVKGIYKTITEFGDKEPYLKSIGERADAIMEDYEHRHIMAQEALRNIAELVKEINEARKKRNETQFDTNTFTVYWILKQDNIKDTETLAVTINSVFVRFPNYNDNNEEMRHLKAELYGVLFPIVGKDNMIDLVEKLLNIKRV
jgi:type I restriction enzyme R subunit